MNVKIHPHSSFEHLNICMNRWVWKALKYLYNAMTLSEARPFKLQQSKWKKPYNTPAQNDYWEMKITINNHGKLRGKITLWRNASFSQMFSWILGKTSKPKKLFNSGIARITQTPPPPNSGNFTDFFRPTKTTFCAYGGKKYWWW